MTACPGCGGKPYKAYGQNPETLAWDVEAACGHLCPVRANAGDYEFCTCCAPCLKSGFICGSPQAEISDPVIPA